MGKDLSKKTDQQLKASLTALGSNVNKILKELETAKAKYDDVIKEIFTRQANKGLQNAKS